MAKKRGVSISAKMISTTLALIVVIISLFGILNFMSIERAYDESVKRETSSYERSIREAGAAQIIAFAEPSKTAMQEERWADIRRFIVAIQERDPRILHLWIANDAGRFVASGDERENERLAETLAPDFLEDPVRERIVGKDFLPSAEELESSDLKPKAIEGEIEELHGQRVMVIAQRLLEQGVYMGSVVMVYSLQQLEDQIAELTTERRKASRNAFEWTAMVGGLFILVGALLAIVQGLGISRPVKTLALSANRIAQGDLESRVRLKSGGELGMLADNFNFMTDQIVILLHETAAKATMTKELDVARDIQQALVPGDDVVDRDCFQFSGYFKPATECGGDWWTYHDMSEGKILVIIGDVTGHGVPSAMITASAKSAVDTLRSVTEEDLTVEYLLEILNKAIFESAKRQFVMTCFATIVDTKNMTVTYANAGHNFPYIYREVDGRGKFSVMMTRGNRLGDLDDSTYESKTDKIQPGDILVWYTDGIVECENAVGEEYGDKRFRQSVRRAKDKNVEEIRKNVVDSAFEFYGDVPQKDDITLVFGRIYAPGEERPKIETKKSTDEQRKEEETDEIVEREGAESDQSAENEDGGDSGKTA